MRVVSSEVTWTTRVLFHSSAGTRSNLVLKSSPMQNVTHRSRVRGKREDASP